MANPGYPIGDIVNEWGSRFQLANYTDTTGATNLQYICESQIGASLTDAVWRIKRIETEQTTDTPLVQGKAVVWANDSAEFDKVATDLATIQANYTFTTT